MLLWDFFMFKNQVLGPTLISKTIRLIDLIIQKTSTKIDKKKRCNLHEKLSKLFKAFLGNFKFAHQFRNKVQCCVIIILIPKISRLISLTYL